MALSRVSGFVNAYPTRLIFCFLCLASFAAFVCVVASYPLLLSSGLASIFPNFPCLRNSCSCACSCSNTSLEDRRYELSHSSLQDRGFELFHSWPDHELFERATLAEASQSAAYHDEHDSSRVVSSRRSRRRSRPSACQIGTGGSKTGTAKIAFMFLTRGPLPFLSLWNRFFHGHEHLYNIYVHLDPFQVGVFDRETAGVFWGRLIPPGHTVRGAPSLAAAARRLLGNALLDDPLNQYFAIVSESCIPIVSFRRMYDIVTATEKSFIEILSGEPTLKRRYKSRGGEAAMLPEVPFSRFRVGSQFFVLNRKHAAMVVADKKIWRKFSRPCINANACFTEEHYIPTLIGIVDARCTTGLTATNVDWSVGVREGGHPRTYKPAEVRKELIVSLRRNGTFLFARKFAEGCLKPLLQLAPFMFDEKPTEPVPSSGFRSDGQQD